MFHAVSKDDSDAITGNDLIKSQVIWIVYIDPDDSNCDRESESNEGVEESMGDDGRVQQVDSPESHPRSQGNYEWLNDDHNIPIS